MWELKDTIAFSMTLINLPNLERLIEEPHSLEMFPQLENLIVYGCRKLAGLLEAQLLTHLNCGVSNYVIDPESDCSEGFVPTSMPLAAWPSLVSLKVGSFVNVDVPLQE